MKTHFNLNLHTLRLIGELDDWYKQKVYVLDTMTDLARTLVQDNKFYLDRGMEGAVQLSDTDYFAFRQSARGMPELFSLSRITAKDFNKWDNIGLSVFNIDLVEQPYIDPETQQHIYEQEESERAAPNYYEED